MQPETLVYAEYVMVLTTFPEEKFSPRLVLEGYRFRWQVELALMRPDLGGLRGQLKLRGRRLKGVKP